ncbi:metal-dependent hydrolase [Sphingomonas sp. S1-29]|uniref:metal-dependent hydrolase n=1 Tax=Sphingomonas sp. S1-29 TaxID=2991074 RepID=UPI00223FAE81|nr:metal-dependent hydrolase [Sphingomonas sp. S1-29]UZK70608.1 metal-dependent hydrolase [Sphingomonas sp. S1-29]
MSKAKTPADLTITPRDRRFGRGGDRYRRWWLNDDPIATAFYNALSVTFPKGEGFFVDSVRKFRDDAPPRLAAEINAFVKQEVLHTREHVAFNRHVTDQGYDVSRLERRVDDELAITKGRPPIANLAATMCLEHFTAILAHELVATPAHLAGGDAEAVAMWRWHAIEEIEHKGVAYDTWMHATRDLSRLRRWYVKSLVMVIVTAKFFRGRTTGILDLLDQDGLRGPAVQWRLFRYAFGRPGMARKIMGAWASFFLPGFHPWNHDDRALIGKVDSDYAAARMPVAA